MENELAPIGVTVYARLEHLRRAIDALKNNALASQSELYVFSDAPRPGDESRVAEVRNYIRTIEGFKSVRIVEREKNGRVENSRGGINALLSDYGKVIFLAEDIVAAPGFLTFMNKALKRYECNERVFSVSGYSPPLKIPDSYQHDVFFLRRFSGWGFGTWEDRFSHIKYMSPAEYEKFASNRARAREFIRGGGADMMRMLKRDAYGEIDAGDVKAMYAQFLKDQYTVYPVQSLVRNIGHDGTGTHCNNTSRFDVVLSDKTAFELPDKVFLDKRIVKANRVFRAMYSPKKIISKILRICLRSVQTPSMRPFGGK